MYQKKRVKCICGETLINGFRSKFQGFGIKQTGGDPSRKLSKLPQAPDAFAPTGLWLVRQRQGKINRIGAGATGPVSSQGSLQDFLLGRFLVPATPVAGRSVLDEF